MPDEKSRVQSFVAHPLAEKKKRKTLVKVTKAPTLAPASPSTSSLSALDSSAHISESVSSSSRLDPSDLGTCSSKPELKPIAFRVIHESEEEEEDKSNDLRVGFKERHYKRLYEAIDMVPPPTKKACPEKAREEPWREVSSTPVARRMLWGLAACLLLRKRLARPQGGPLAAPLLLRKSRTKKTLLHPLSLLAGMK